MSRAVRIVEVGPRDGLQNEKTAVSVADRVAFVEALVAAGLTTVEVGAFVSPRAIPQMAGSDLNPLSRNFGRITSQTSSLSRFCQVQARIQF